MPLLSEEKFSFVSIALPVDTFGVVNFKGVEGLNRCYEFEIDLVSENKNVDLEQVLESKAVLTILGKEGDIRFNGILVSFEQRQYFERVAFYRAVLVPKLYWLELTHHNQVFLNQSVPEVIEAVLTDGGLTDLDYELRLRSAYPKKEYICQYQESHLSFICRWMEREGLYYYFEQTDNGEKVIITDTHLSHGDMPQGAVMFYSPPSGLDAEHVEEAIKSLICRQQLMPREVILKDYNCQAPSLDIKGQAQVKAKGRGRVYYYGDHFLTPEEGAHVASIRAQEILCREKVFSGETGIPYLRPGYTFQLHNHYRDDYNQKYLTIGLYHQGGQSKYLTAGLRSFLGEEEEGRLYYRNSFSAIPAGTQFRPEIKTEKTRFYGTLNARIDAAGSGQYAELDHQGRYKVILPFDLSGRKDGKASAFIRMMQPYCGTDHGMHFPLHKGTEVLLTFTHGDPDRPIIAGAVPNPDQPSMVNNLNQTMSMITTSGQNKIHIEDQEGNQRILLHSPTAGSYLRLGSHNDPGSSGGDAGFQGIHLETDKMFKVDAGFKNEMILGNEFKFIGGASEEVIEGIHNKEYIGAKTELALGITLKANLAFHTEYGSEYLELRPKKTALHAVKTNLEGQLNTLTGKTTTLAGETIKLAGEVSTLAGEVTDLAEQTSSLTDEVNVVAVQTDILATVVNQVAGNQNIVIGEQNTTVGETTGLVGEAMTVVANRTEAIGTTTTTIGDESRIIGEHTDINAENTSISGLKVFL